MEAEATITPTLEIAEVALIPADNLPMDEALKEVRALGHTVVRVEGRKIIVKESPSLTE